MNKDLQSYVKVYNKWFDEDKCRKTIEDIRDKNWEQHVFYDSHTDTSVTVSGSKELDVTFDSPRTSEYLYQRCWDGIYKYIDEFRFHWWSGWSGFSPLRFNHYKTGRVMAEHCDHITTMFDGNKKGIPILTLLGIFNDDYEGGELIMWQDTVIELKAGDLLIFPSNFLYPHRIDEVTKGERFSMVSWVW